MPYANIAWRHKLHRTVAYVARTTAGGVGFDIGVDVDVGVGFGVDVGQVSPAVNHCLAACEACPTFDIARRHAEHALRLTSPGGMRSMPYANIAWRHKLNAPRRGMRGTHNRGMQRAQRINKTGLNAI